MSAAKPPAAKPWRRNAAEGSTVSSETLPQAAGERLQKVMAAAGVGSRRACEQLIGEGRVQVNGKTVTRLGVRVRPECDTVSVNGLPVAVDPQHRFVLLNKPRGIICSLDDEEGRPDLRSLLTPYLAAGVRLFHVGRLDADTGGLLLLTNHGKLTQVLTHPAFGVPKTYLALVRGPVSPNTLRQLRAGVELEDGSMRVDTVRHRGSSRADNSTLLEIVIHSGRNRVVRRLLEAVGHPVIDLHRISFGPLQLGGLPVGKTRPASRSESSQLLALLESSPTPKTREAAASKARGSTGRSPLSAPGLGKASHLSSRTRPRKPGCR